MEDFLLTPNNSIEHICLAVWLLGLLATAGTDVPRGDLGGFSGRQRHGPRHGGLSFRPIQKATNMAQLRTPSLSGPVSTRSCPSAPERHGDPDPACRRPAWHSVKQTLRSTKSQKRFLERQPKDSPQLGGCFPCYSVSFAAQPSMFYIPGCSR